MFACIVVKRKKVKPQCTSVVLNSTRFFVFIIAELFFESLSSDHVHQMYFNWITASFTYLMKKKEKRKQISYIISICNCVWIQTLITKTKSTVLYFFTRDLKFTHTANKMHVKCRYLFLNRLSIIKQIIVVKFLYENYPYKESNTFFFKSSTYKRLLILLLKEFEKKKIENTEKLLNF